MNGLGVGLAWMGFWLFLGAACSTFNLSNDRSDSYWEYRTAVETCQKAEKP